MGTTDKKKKEATEAVDNGSGNSSGDAASSLQARRAKLRGALGGRNASYPDPFTAPPPDEYGAPQNDPYGQNYGQQDPYNAQSYGQQAQQDPNYADQNADPYGQQPDSYGQANDPYDLAAMAQVAANYDSTSFDYGQGSEPPVNVYGVPITAESIDEAVAALEGTQEEAPETEASAPEPEPSPAPAPVSSKKNKKNSAPSIFETAAAAPAPIPSLSSSSSSRNSESLPVVTEKTAELVESIDQSLNICATNLAALQNLAGEQTSVLRGLTQTLQNQTLMEIGLNLNSLTESLTAALEPMKAIGELVPALDSLVLALEGKEAQENEKLSPDQLVTSLADQLSAGLIDPWTFKCAYMAVYPSDPPAELLHRLVELLGQQRISGDLFRAAYEAVQAAEAPPRTSYGASSGEFSGAGISDEAVRAQLESLERSNREMQRRMDEREHELSQLLSQKDSELQGAQEQLNQRMEDLNNRYSEAADLINSREEEFRAALESKDMDLIEKDAELNMLRNQMEELRSNTEEMVRDLQKEMLSLRDLQTQHSSAAPQHQQHHEPAPANSQGFFDSQQTSSGANRPGLFEATPAQNKPGVFASDPGSGFDAPLTSNEFSDGFNSGGGFQQGFQNPQTPQFQPPPQPSFAQPAPAPAPAPPQPNRPQPGMAPPTTPQFGGGQSGSYGMGVRQQVFEVIVRQALAGAQWRELCAGPMQVNNISPEEVESEVKRRQSLLNK